MIISKILFDIPESAGLTTSLISDKIKNVVITLFLEVINQEEI